MINYVQLNLWNQVTIKRTYKLKYIFANKRTLEYKKPKQWKGEEMLLVEDMQIVEETERLEQNLMRVDRVENEGNNSDGDIPDKQDDDLII